MQHPNNVVHLRSTTDQVDAMLDSRPPSRHERFRRFSAGTDQEQASKDLREACDAFCSTLSLEAGEAATGVEPPPTGRRVPRAESSTNFAVGAVVVVVLIAVLVAALAFADALPLITRLG